jgi:hypothetical protein
MSKEEIKDFFKEIENMVIKMDKSLLLKEIEFKGFSPDAYIIDIMKDSAEETLKIATTGALRGGNWDKLNDIPDFAITLNKLGYVRKREINKAQAKTILRTTAVLAPEAAVVLSNAKYSKRIEESEVPSCLQFPAAATITMSNKARILHKDFCKRFSELLPNGIFNESIYLQMSNKTRSLPQGGSKEIYDFVNQV